MEATDVDRDLDTQIVCDPIIISADANEPSTMSGDMYADTLRDYADGQPLPPGPPGCPVLPTLSVTRIHWSR